MAMPERTASAVPLVATRYDLSRWTLAQALVPITTLASVAARRVPSTITTVVAVLMLVANLTALLRARRRLGSETLCAVRGRLRLQMSGEELSRATIRRWISRGGVVWLYSDATSYKLKVAEPHRTELEAVLTQALGAMSATRRRGSPRARVLAAGVCLLGLMVLGLAIALQLPQLLVVAVPAVIFGIAAFGALSQRVVC